MKPHPRAMLERPGARQHVDDGVGAARLDEGAGCEQGLSAADLFHLDAAQVDG